MSEPITREDAEFLSLEDRALLMRSGITYINEIADTMLESASEEGITLDDDDFRAMATAMYMSASATLLGSMSTDKEDAMDLASLLMADAETLDVHPLALDFMEDL
tara:strand:+ start:7289 stop:7606 length:318 start_codon:yes stop_codon:yes gene_type:complete